MQHQLKLCFDFLNSISFIFNLIQVEITNNNPASGKLANNFRGPRNVGHNSAPNLVGPRPVRNGGGCPLRCFFSDCCRYLEILITMSEQ